MSQDISSPLAGDTKAVRENQPESRSVASVVGDVLAEVLLATRKFPTWPTDPLHALAVLGEEFGELTKDVLQLTYEPHKTNAENVRKEAVQTAAMALRFLASLDAYEYRPGQQHAQGPATSNQSGEDRAAFVSPRKSEDE